MRQALELFDVACEKLAIAHEGVARVEVMTETYCDRWLQEEPERYAGVSEIADLLGVSKQRVSELRTKPTFPEPVVELAAGPVWRLSSLQRFVAGWPRKPGRPRKATPAG